MPEFKRKKGSIVSKVSVHDSKINGVSLKNDELILELDRCIVLSSENAEGTMSEVGPAYIKLQKFDKSQPMTSLYILGKKKYKSLNFKQFMKMFKNGDIFNVEIIDVFYRNIDIMLIGVLRQGKKWKEFQLRLCYLGDMMIGYDIPEEST